jgi:hypothetical protein
MNFIRAWGTDPNIPFKVSDSFRDKYGRDRSPRVLAIPYFATPPIDLLDLLKTPRKYSSPFKKAENDALTDLLGGMWTVPPDWRLDFNFQHHILRRKGVAGVVKYVEQLQKRMLDLYKFGGSFEIADIGENNRCHRYNMKSPLTAALVEEFFVAFPTKDLFHCIRQILH